MDIRRSDNGIYIKAGDKDNDIEINRKGNKLEINIDGEKISVEADRPVVIDAGKGNDFISVSNLSQGKLAAPLVTIIGGEGDDSVFSEGNVNFADRQVNDSFANKNPFSLTTKVNNYVSELEELVKDKKEPLNIETKKKVINLLKDAANDEVLPDLAKKLDQNGKLEDLYHDLGTLVNQGNAGAMTSLFLGIFTLGTSFVAEAKENYAYEMYEVLKKAGTDPDLLKKLRPHDQDLQAK